MELTNYILCIDDDTDDYTLLAEALQNANASWTLHHENSGQRAIDFLHTVKDNSNWPQLIILDINLPAMNGIQILASIRKQFSIPHVPIIFLSTTITHDYVILAENQGVSILQKPSTVQGYDHIIQTILMLIVEK